MPAEDVQILLDQFKAANVALEAKLADLQSRSTLSDQQLVELKAEIAKAIEMGK